MSMGIPGRPFRRTLREAAADRFRAVALEQKRLYRENGMSKLQHVATRAPQIIAELEGRAEQLDKRLTKLSMHGHDTFDKWDSHLDEADKAVSEAENAINQLSNSPLPESSPEQPFPQPGAGNGAAPKTE